VGARIDPLPARLLRRHEGDGALEAGRRVHDFAITEPVPPRETEVHEDGTIGTNKDLARLEIAMNDPFAVEKRQRLRDAAEDGQYLEHRFRGHDGRDATAALGRSRGEL